MDRTAPRKTKNKDVGTRRRDRIAALPWRHILLATAPIALSVGYVAWVAPELVPVPAGVKVPFPAATRHLERACIWCGEHRAAVVLAGAGLLAAGLLFRFRPAAERYYARLAVVVSLLLCFTYLSISAPIDRLMRKVEESIPEDRRVPDHGVKKER